MKRRIDAHRSGEFSAIAAAEKERPLMRRKQKMRYQKRRRRLAGAAGGEIAEADHRHAGRLALRLNARPRHRAINRGQGREQAAAALAPPEGRLAHHSMIPKKPAPDLIRGGYRFSDKIMRITKKLFALDATARDKDRARRACDRARRRVFARFWRRLPQPRCVPPHWRARR